MPNQIKIQLNVDEDLSGLNRARSALDDFNRSAAQGFAKTRSAMDDMSKGGISSLGNLRRQVVDLQKAHVGSQQAVLQNTLAQSRLNEELQAGTVAGGQHATVLKQLQERQKTLAAEAKSAQQIFRAARQELMAFLGGAFSGADAGPLAAAGGGMIYSNRAPSLASTLGLPATPAIRNALGSIFSHGLGPISGPGLAFGGFTLGSLTIGNSNRAVSTLGGLGSGALIGTSILPGIGTAIGAAIGGIVGLFTGGDGKNKTHDADIANQGFAQLHQILDDYYNFRRNYASAVDEAYKIWQQMDSKWVRKQSAISQRPYFDQIVTAIQQTEDERNRRRQLQSLLPVPEFAQGGYVGSAGVSPASGMLALLHAGEFVMTRQAVDRIGTSVLQGLNQGTANSAQGTGSALSIEPASASTLSNFLKSNPQALDEGLLVVLRRGGPASRALRG